MDEDNEKKDDDVKKKEKKKPIEYPEPDDGSIIIKEI